MESEFDHQQVKWGPDSCHAAFPLVSVRSQTCRSLRAA